MLFTENDIRHEMQRLDVQAGIDTSKIPIRISTRMTSTWGKCVYNLSKGKVKEFVFGDRLLRYATYEHLVEVVRHEYAHAFVFIKYGKRDAHGSRWRYWAQKFGCSGSRCNSFSEVLEAQADLVSRYKVTCASCGAVYRYQRRTNIVKALENDPYCTNYRCGKCKGDHFFLHSNTKK